MKTYEKKEKIWKKASFAWNDSTGYESYKAVNTSYAVRPAVYLKSDLRIVSGTGESGNPYVLE